MIKITNETLFEAADNYVATKLGDPFFNKFGETETKISGDFISGALYVLRLIEDDPEIIDKTIYPLNCNNLPNHARSAKT